MRNPRAALALPFLLAVVLGGLATAADRVPAAEQIRVGAALPELPEDSFSELHGFPPTAAEMDGRVIAFVTFQAGTSDELDLVLATISDLEGLNLHDRLIVLGVATCLDVKRDALSLDDSYISTIIQTSDHATVRVVRDKDEQFWPRMMVRSGGSLRRGTPAIAVVGASGRVFFTGFLTSKKKRSRAQQAVSAAVTIALSPDLGESHPLLAEPSADYAADRLAAALRGVESVLGRENLPAAAAAEAAELLFLIEARFESEMARVDRLLEEGRARDALDTLKSASKAFGSSEPGEEARARLNELEEDAAMEIELKAERAFDKQVEDLKKKDLTRERTRRKVLQKLVSLAERFPDTRNAVRALEEAARIRRLAGDE